MYYAKRKLCHNEFLRKKLTYIVFFHYNSIQSKWKIMTENHRFEEKKIQKDAHPYAYNIQTDRHFLIHIHNINKLSSFIEFF